MTTPIPPRSAPGARPAKELHRRVVGLALVAIVSLGVLAGCTSPDVEYLDTATVLPAGLPFSEAVRVGDTLYLSGQIGVKPGTLELVPGGMEAEARQTLQNIRDVLRAHGSDLEDVVKCTVMLADIAEWGAFNAVYAQVFEAPFPARSALGANGLALGARVEVECIAVVRR